MTQAIEGIEDTEAVEVLLNVNAVAKLLNITAHCLRNWRDEGWGPPAIDLAPPVRQKPLLRYRRRDVLAWVESLIRKDVAA